MKYKSILSLALVAMAATALGGFVWWRLETMKHLPPPAQFAIIIDASDSVSKNCETEKRLVRALMSRASRKGSTLALLRTGDDSTRLEPQRIFSRELPPSLSSMPFSGRAKTIEAAEAVVRDATAACKGIQIVKQSPIVKAVRRGVTHLKSSKCQKGSGCVLVVHTDLQDTDEMAGNRGGAAVAPIDNHGIEVILCGYSDVIQDHASVATDAMLESWKRLFVDPVTFAPFCGDSIFAGRTTANAKGGI